VTPHDLRHTAASLAISAGANPKAVQTMLGHASAVLTLDTYADLFPTTWRWCRPRSTMPVAPHSNRRCTNLLRTDCGLAVYQRQQISPN
jgi:hypothetical protein